MEFAFTSNASYNHLETLEYTQASDVYMANARETPATYANRGVNISSESPAACSQTNYQLDRLRFLQLAEWDENNSYDEDVPTCLHYSIEWKVNVNNKVISKDTEQDLVLMPNTYWHLFLKPKLEKLLRNKLAQNRHIRCEDTSIVLSVTARSERDVHKRFDQTDIDWSIVEKQLFKWGELFRTGKKLRVDISFNYMDLGAPVSGISKGYNKQGSSATQRMLVDQNLDLEAEKEHTGKPAVWREVYGLMQCPGPPCDLGPHCWRDPLGKKHHKLRTQHLRALVRYVEQGNQLHSHEDIPDDIREQLLIEAEQRTERQASSHPYSTPSFPPINITNVLPGSGQSPIPVSSVETSAALRAPISTIPVSSALEIPGFRDVALKKYTEWQQSRVADNNWKAEFQKAYSVALGEDLDLELIHIDKAPGFFVQNGVKLGTARRFVSDIEVWVKQYREHSIEESLL